MFKGMEIREIYRECGADTVNDSICNSIIQAIEFNKVLKSGKYEVRNVSLMNSGVLMEVIDRGVLLKCIIGNGKVKVNGYKKMINVSENVV